MNNADAILVISESLPELREVLNDLNMEIIKIGLKICLEIIFSCNAQKIKAIWLEHEEVEGIEKYICFAAMNMK